MNKLLLLSCFLLGFISYAQAQTVTYSEDIAPIIYSKCTNCHRTGEVGPMPFTNYNEVQAWASMIQYVTEIKYMPPWKPNPDYSNFIGENYLDANEIQLIKDWVTQGTPQGDPSLEPPLPNFPSGSQLGTPDLVLSMAESYTVQGNNQDDYRVFVLPSGLTVDKDIAAIEFRPGNTKAVHHALIAYETQGAAAALDATTPEYGYESFGGFEVTPEGTFNSYTPGIKNVFYPTNIGKRLPANSDVLIQMHYAPLPTTEVDSSSLNIFYKQGVTRVVETTPVTPFSLTTGLFSFFILPDEVKTFHGTTNVNKDISMVSVYPHAHLLAINYEIYAVTPNNDTINIIKIDEWDFNWQGSYTFKKLKKIPSGSVIHTFATYDNTLNNPYNPSNPPQMSTWGEGTTDEMYLVGLNHVDYETGDENIDLTTNTEDIIYTPTDKLYPPFPNPTDGTVNLGFYLTASQSINISLYDMNGILVRNVVTDKTFPGGQNKVDFDISDISNGNYFVHLKGQRFNASQKLVILK